jgi:hypothetical protein
LIIVEISWHGDDSLLNLLSKLGLCDFFHLSSRNRSTICRVEYSRQVGGYTFIKTIEEISWGEKVLVSPRYSTSTTGFPPWSTTLKGHDSISFFTMGSS